MVEGRAYDAGSDTTNKYVACFHKLTDSDNLIFRARGRVYNPLLYRRSYFHHFSLLPPTFLRSPTIKNIRFIEDLKPKEILPYFFRDCSGQARRVP